MFYFVFAVSNDKHIWTCRKLLYHEWDFLRLLRKGSRFLFRQLFNKLLDVIKSPLSSVSPSTPTKTSFSFPNDNIHYVIKSPSRGSNLPLEGSIGPWKYWRKTWKKSNPLIEYLTDGSEESGGLNGATWLVDVDGRAAQSREVESSPMIVHWNLLLFIFTFWLEIFVIFTK